MVFLDGFSPAATDSHGAAQPQISLLSVFLRVLRVFAVKVLSRINRQDPKSAKKSAKKNSFQAAKDFRVSSTVRGRDGIAFGGKQFVRTWVTADASKHLTAAGSSQNDVASPTGFEPVLPH